MFTTDEINAHNESVRGFNQFRARQTVRTPDDKQVFATLSLGLGFLALLLCSAAAWVTHVIVCIQHAAWILLLFGCFVMPVGVIHGIGIWLGVF